MAESDGTVEYSGPRSAEKCPVSLMEWKQCPACIDGPRPTRHPCRHGEVVTIDRAETSDNFNNVLIVMRVNGVHKNVSVDFLQ